MPSISAANYINVRLPIECHYWSTYPLFLLDFLLGSLTVIVENCGVGGGWGVVGLVSV